MKYFVIQRGRKYLTPAGGWSLRLGAALVSGTREAAARKKELLRSRGTINLVDPRDCAECREPFDPFMSQDSQLCSFCKE